MRGVGTGAGKGETKGTGVEGTAGEGRVWGGKGTKIWNSEWTELGKMAMEHRGCEFGPTEPRNKVERKWGDRAKLELVKGLVGSAGGL